MGISQPVTIVGISQPVSEYYITGSEFWILDFDGNQILDTESLNISEFTGVSE